MNILYFLRFPILSYLLLNAYYNSAIKHSIFQVTVIIYDTIITFFQHHDH